MSCAETVDLLSRRRDNALAPGQRRALATHLADCPACRRRAQELDTAMTALWDLPAAAPQALRDGVYSKLAAPRLSWSLLPLAAGLLIGFTSAYLFVVKQGSPPPHSRLPTPVSQLPPSHPLPPTDYTLQLSDHARRADAFVRQAAALGDDGATFLQADYSLSDLGPRTRRLAAAPVPDEYSKRILQPLGPVVEALDRRDPAALAAVRRIGSDAGFRETLASYAGRSSEPSPVAVPEISDGELKDFLQAKSLFYAGRPGEALSRFQDFRARHPESPFADDAAFWMARAAAESGDYARALPLYIEVSDAIWLDPTELERLKSCAGALQLRLDAGATLDVQLPGDLDLNEILRDILANQVPHLPAGTITAVYQVVRTQLDKATLAALERISARYPALKVRDCGKGEWEITVPTSQVPKMREDAAVAEDLKAAEKKLPFLFKALKIRPSGSEGR
ncbi:MAG: tetratricopeptide repeat protein [Planctomycetota bacterium]